MHLHRRAAALDTAGKDRGFLHPPGQELNNSFVNDIGMKELVHTLPYVVTPSGTKTQFGTAVKGGDAAKRRRFREGLNLKASSLSSRAALETSVGPFLHSRRKSDRTLHLFAGDANERTDAAFTRSREVAAAGAPRDVVRVMRIVIAPSHSLHSVFFFQIFR